MATFLVSQQGDNDKQMNYCVNFVLNAVRYYQNKQENNNGV